jgi:hypothetical protein
MENKVKNAVENFIDTDQTENLNNENVKKVILDKREGLIERVDKIYLTEDGRQLLREQY